MGLMKWGLTCFVTTVVQIRTIVLLMKFSAKNPPLHTPPERLDGMSKKLVSYAEIRIPHVKADSLYLRWTWVNTVKEVEIKKEQLKAVRPSNNQLLRPTKPKGSCFYQLSHKDCQFGTDKSQIYTNCHPSFP